MLQLVVVTYEFTFRPFSGNGILARSLVKSLLQQQVHQQQQQKNGDVGKEKVTDFVKITVWCCKPAESNVGDGGHNHLSEPELSAEQCSRLTVVGTLLLKEEGWFRLDEGSAHNAFHWDRLSMDDERKQLSTALYNADAVCVVDWTGACAYRSIPSNVWNSNQQLRPPMIYLNFRVYGSGRLQRDWFDEMERKALRDANEIVVLSEGDAASIRGILLEKRNSLPFGAEEKYENNINNRGTGGRCIGKEHHVSGFIGKNCEASTNIRDCPSDLGKNIHIMYPPLRGDLQKLAVEMMEQQCQSKSQLHSKDDELLDGYLPDLLRNVVIARHCRKNAQQQQPNRTNPEQLEFQKFPSSSPLISHISDDNQSKEKFFITCLVRLSPEKQPLRFVDMMQSCQDVVLHKDYVPLLICAGDSTSEYANQVKSAMRGLYEVGTTADDDIGERITNNVVVLETPFLSAKQLASILQRTVLNVHPCPYDAYGMTIIEAAAFGVPSIVANQSQVGAAALLGSGCIQVGIPRNPSTPLPQTTIDAIRSCLQNDSAQLEVIGSEARQRALAWDEASYGMSLRCVIERAILESASTERRNEMSLAP